jgi:hypothetical protein
MSKQFHNEADYERQDLRSKTVLLFFVGLVIMLLVAYLVVAGVYKGFGHYDQAHQPEQNPLAVDTSSGADRRAVPKQAMGDQIKRDFPEPRLEEDERVELQDLRGPKDEQLATYGWVDEKAGVVHIPIERAMELVVQRGLPVRPQGGPVVATAGGAKKK